MSYGSTSSWETRSTYSSSSTVEELDREDLFYELLDGVERGEVELVESLLEWMSVDEVCQLDPREGSASFGLSPLHMANTSSIAKKLLAFGVPVDLEGCCSATPLISCCKYPRVVNVLLKHGASVNHATLDGTTALHHAVLCGSLESAKLLVAAGSDVNRQDAKGNSSLHMVGTLSIARFLVDSGADVTLTNMDNNIPLEEAVAKGRHFSCMEVAAFLLDASQRFNKSRTQQLLDSLKSHVLSMGSQQGEEKEALVPIRSIGSLSDDETKEEKIAYETTETYGPREKWQAVKNKVLQGKLKMVKFKLLPRRNTASEIKRGQFANRSRSYSDLSRRFQVGFFQSFFELMVKERPELARRILDQQRTLLYQRHGCSTYAYSLDLVGTPLRCTAAVRTMVKESRYELLSHPVVQWQITAKFIIFTRYMLYVEFALSLLYCGLIVATTSTEPKHLTKWSTALFHGTFISQPSWANAGDAARMLSWLVLVLFSVRQLATHVIAWKANMGQVKCMKRKLSSLVMGSDNSVFYDWRSFAYVFIILREILLEAYPNSLAVQEFCRVLGAVSFLLTTLVAISFAEGLYERFGLTVFMIRRMFYDSRSYFHALAVFISCFSVCMTILYSGSDVSDFATLSSSFVSLFFFVFNLDISLIQQDPQLFRRSFAFFFLGLYMIIVVLTIVNLIIAVYSNTYDEVKQLAREQSVFSRARFVIQMEDQFGLFMKIMERFFPSRCPNRSNWYDWEKSIFTGRKALVREYPSGRTDIDTRAEILQYVYSELCPPLFLYFTKFYESTSCLISPMEFGDSFKWSQLDTSSLSSKCCPKTRADRLNKALAFTAEEERQSLLAESTNSTSAFNRGERPPLSSQPSPDTTTIFVGYFMRHEKYDHDKKKSSKDWMDDAGSPRPRFRTSSNSSQDAPPSHF